MAFLLGTEKARVDMSSKTVLNEVSVGLSEGDRIGIVGLNGEGKSTLVRLLASDLTLDSGRVVKTGGVRVGLLRQTDDLNDEDTVQFAIFKDRPDYEWASDARIRDILEGLLFDIGLDERIGNLSGGQRHRVDMARVLVGDWDVLMLDEPTNHLDMRTIAWLANHLQHRWRKGSGALVVISHDRWFLDEVCNLMWEVHDGNVLIFEGGFSAYIMQRVERARIAQVTEQRRQNRLSRELAWLARGARARATKPKFHVKAARELIADVPELRKPLQLRRAAMARIGKDFVDLQGVTVEFPIGEDANMSADDADLSAKESQSRTKKVLDDINWILGPGERIGIVGENGAGKTTLLNVIRGKLKPTSGRAKIGSTVKFTMLSQRLDDLVEHEGERVRELVGRYGRREMSDGTELAPSKILEDLGFNKGDLNEHIRNLSGGQKRRLALMMVLMEEANVLILDEPGNDLDIDMLAALEDMLDAWPGTLILVTHDRNLMERATDNQYALMDGTLRHLPGGIDEYLKLKGSRDSRNADDPTVLDTASDTNSPKEASETKALSNKERQRLVKLVASLEKKIATLEGKIAEATEDLNSADPTDFEELTVLQKKIDELNDQKSDLEMQWLEASETLIDAENA